MRESKGRVSEEKRCQTGPRSGLWEPLEIRVIELQRLAEVC